MVCGPTESRQSRPSLLRFRSLFKPVRDAQRHYVTETRESHSAGVFKQRFQGISILPSFSEFDSKNAVLIEMYQILFVVLC
jgi:hypothetical protein